MTYRLHILVDGSRVATVVVEARSHKEALEQVNTYGEEIKTL